MSELLNHDPLRPPSVDISARGGVLALAAHVLLVVALSLGVSWHIQTPQGGEAELWSEIPKVAAPAPETAPPPEPMPKVEPTPRPEPAPPAVEPEPTPRPAQIAIKKTPPKPLAKPKPEPKPEPKPKPAPKPKPEPKPKPQPAKPTQADAAEQARAEAVRKQYLQRMMSAAGGSDDVSASPNTGRGPASMSRGYANRVAAAIKRNIVFPDTISGNPLAVVSVRCLPNGRIIARRLVKSSGAPAWDDAVLRAIDRTETLPLNDDGSVPTNMEIEFRPQDR